MLKINQELAPKSPELTLFNFFAISLPSQPFLGLYLGFHIYSLLGGCTFFLQLGCFELDFTSFCTLLSLNFCFYLSYYGVLLLYCILV